MPRYMRIARDELVNLLEAFVRKGCIERVHAVLVARGQASRLSQAESLTPEFRIVLKGFEQITDKSGNTLVEAKGEIRVLFGGNEQGVRLEGLGLEFRPFTIRVEDGSCLGVKGQPVLPAIVGTLAHLPTEEAVINGKAATIRFYRPLAGWEGFYLCIQPNPAEPYWFVAGNLTEIRVAWN
jgi:hypothetical protein